MLDDLKLGDTVAWESGIFVLIALGRLSRRKGRAGIDVAVLRRRGEVDAPAIFAEAQALTKLTEDQAVARLIAMRGRR